MIIDHKKTALISGELQVTYTELIETINNYASAFKKHKGKHVAIYMENRPEWVYAFYGSWKVGATNVLIDMMGSEEELEYILRDCSPKLLVTSNKNAAKVKKAVSKLPVTKKPAVLNVDTQTIKPAKTLLDEFKPQEDDIRLLLYTSGTTGNSKGVKLTHKNVMKNVRWNNDSKRINKTDRLLAVLPTHHSWPLMSTILCPLDCGATTIFLPELNAEMLLKTLKENKITMLTGVPRLFEMLHTGVMREVKKNSAALVFLALFKLLYKLPGNRIFGRAKAPHTTLDIIPLTKVIFKKVHETFGGNIKIFISGGAKLDNQIIEDFRAMGILLVEGYGLTETAPMVTYHPFDKIKIGSTGRVFAEIDIQFADDGEIQLKGPNVTPGYYNRPDENEINFTEDGYFKTGDIGYIDKERYLYLTGRKKDLIILSNGKNVRPDLIENKIKLSNPLVKDIAITASGNNLFAVVVPDMIFVAQEGIGNIKEKIKFDVIDAYNQTAENYKKIHDFLITADDIPRTRLGKLQRYKLTQFIQSRKDKKSDFKIKPPKIEEYKVISEYLKEVTGVNISPNAHIEIDLGLDSLELVELQMFLRKTFGVTLNEGEIPKYSVVKELAQYVHEKKTDSQTSGFDWKTIFTADISWQIPTRLWMLKVFHVIFRIFLGWKLKLKGKGIENVPEGPCIIAPNHTSYLDSIVVYNFLKRKHREDLFFLAKEKNFRSSFLRTFAHNAHVVIMDINRDLVLSLQKIATLLKNGKKVLIFPEGTRTRDGNIQKFKTTFAQISKALNVPVIPVAIKGAFDAMPYTAKLPRGGEVEVDFLLPVNPENLSEEEIVEKTRSEILQELSAVKS
jgi:long-chain acyl-CoA synthetase